MTLTSWAEKEIELAKKRERGDNNDDGWDYGCACYDSAFKAYKALMEDGHSGMSYSLTIGILERLLHNIPLSPITDDDFEEVRDHFGQEWLDDCGLISTQQCKRRGSVWKDTHKDGTITYHDNSRYYCQNVNNSWNTCTSGRAMKYLDELFPITMPYTPSINKYVIVTDDFLYDESQKRWNDWDTEAYFEIITPEGEHVELNKFYKIVFSGEYETIPATETVKEKQKPIFEKVEITKEEYLERKAAVK